MGGLGRALGGILTGVGKGLEQQSLYNMQRDRDDVLYRRQVALEGIKNEHEIGRENLAQTHRLDLDTHQTGNKMVATRAELIQRGQLDAQSDEREASAARSKELLEYNIWLKKQPIELQNNLTLEDFRQDRQDSRAAADREATTGRDVAARGVDADGNLVIVKGDDSVVTTRGIRPLPSGTSSGFDIPADAATSTGGGLLEQPTASSSRSERQTYTVADFNAAMAEAGQLKARGDPRFKDKTPTQIRQEVRAWFESRGLRLSTDGG